MDDDVLYKPPAKAEQSDEKNFSPSKSSDEEEEEDEVPGTFDTVLLLFF